MPNYILLCVCTRVIIVCMTHVTCAELHIVLCIHTCNYCLYDSRDMCRITYCSVYTYTRVITVCMTHVTCAELHIVLCIHTCNYCLYDSRDMC